MTQSTFIGVHKIGQLRTRRNIGVYLGIITTSDWKAELGTRHTLDNSTNRRRAIRCLRLPLVSMMLVPVISSST